MKRPIGVLLLVTLALTACGSDGEPSSDAEITVTTTIDAPSPTTSFAPASSVANGATVAATLTEFVIDAPESYDAGPVIFEVANNGEFSHEFGVVRGARYEDLPLTDVGGIDEAALGADVLGKTATLSAGDADTLTIDLPAGEYVLYCNVGARGPVSHAARGQVLSITAT